MKLRKQYGNIKPKWGLVNTEPLSNFSSVSVPFSSFIIKSSMFYSMRTMECTFDTSRAMEICLLDIQHHSSHLSHASFSLMAWPFHQGMLYSFNINRFLLLRFFAYSCIAQRETRFFWRNRIITASCFSNHFKKGIPGNLQFPWDCSGSF